MKNYWLPIIVYMFSTAYFLSYCQYGINICDEGIPLYGGIRVLKGQLPLVDFWGYMPGRYYLYALIFKTWGQDIAKVRVIMAVVSGVIPLLAFLVARQVVGSAVALLPVVLILVAPGVYYTRFYTLCLMVNIYFLGMHLLQNTNLKNFLYSIALVLFTFYFKFEVGLVSGLIVLVFYLVDHLVIRTRSSAIKYSLAQLVPAIACVCMGIIIFLPYLGHLDLIKDEISSDISSFNGGFGIALYSPLNLPDSFSLEEILEYFENMVFYISLLICGIIILKIVRDRDSNGKNLVLPGDVSENRLLLILLLFFLGSAPMMFMRYVFGYMLRIIPPVHIMGAVVLYWLSRYTLYNLNSLKSWIKIPGIIMLIILWTLPIMYVYDMVVTEGFFYGSIGEIFNNGDHEQDDNMHVPLGLPNANIYCDKKTAQSIREVVPYVQEHSTKTDSILVFPYDPIWYYLCERDNAIRYDWTVPGKISASAKQKEIIKMITDNWPVFILMSDWEIGEGENSRFRDYANLVNDFVYSNYVPEVANDLVEILRGEEGKLWIDFTSYETHKQTMIQLNEQVMLDYMESHGVNKPILIQSIPGKMSFKVKLGNSPVLISKLLIMVTKSSDRHGQMWAEISINDGKNENSERLFRFTVPVSSTGCSNNVEKIRLDLQQYAANTVIINFETGYNLDGMLMGDTVYWIHPRILERNN